MQLVASRESAQHPRILCISPLFAPMANAEAFCSAKLLAALQDAGAEVTVISCSNVLNEQRLIDHSSLWKDLLTVQTDVTVSQNKEPLQSIWWVLRYQTAIYSRWVADVVRKARALHRQHAFEVVYSRSLPMCSHVAGYWCAKSLRLPWIANLNDPWEAQFMAQVAFPNLSLSHSLMYKLWLRRTLRNADRVTYPCSRLHRFHESVSGIKHEGAIIPHVASTSHAGNVQSGLFHLVHAGKLGTAENPKRPVEPFLAALKSFLDETPNARSSIRLTLVGPEDRGTTKLIFDLGLHNVVASTGQVSYEQSLQHIASASVCVLLEAVLEEGIFFPSKLVDYIAAGKPVLAISPEQGTVADMAATQPCIVRVSQNDVAVIKKAIASLYLDFTTNKWAARLPKMSFQKQFAAENVAKEFLATAETVLQDSRATSAEPIGASQLASEVN
jgi:glycosyltransferase involved in cell wall biosynthesis